MIQDHTLAGGNHKGQREQDDFYRTPEWATEALIVRESLDGSIWEPACGDGAISKLLRANDIGTPIYSSDLFNRGYGVTGINFLDVLVPPYQSRPIIYDSAIAPSVNHVITNPPYKLAQQFVEHALEVCSGKVAMLLKLNFLEGIKRHEFFQRTPLKTVYVFSKRLSFDKGNQKSGGKGLLAYAWFVWDHSYKGKPQIDWILECQTDTTSQKAA